MEIKASIAFTLCLLMGGNLPVFADTLLWQDIKPLAAKSVRMKGELSEATLKSSELSYQNARFLNLNLEQMTSQLNAPKLAAKDVRSKQKSTLTKINLPLPDGRLISVSVVENKLMPSLLLKNFPQIKMLDIVPDDFVVTGKLDVTVNGFHAMLQTRQGETIFIDPVGDSVYASYQKSDQQVDSDTAFSCSAHSQEDIIEKSQSSLAFKSSGRTQKSLINYRIAIAATGEYTAKHGGTVAGAMSAIATTINRVNQVYEQDLGIHLSLVENNDKLIYINANTDPYSGSSKELVYENQSNIDAIIGSGSYDIGHLFTSSGGGLAAIASACSGTRKAQGVSGVSNPRNDSFNLDFVAHEIGHQFGATHTFNGVQGLCSGNTRSARTAFEPGSGSTIMSYAGYCGGDNLQRNTDAMFHIGSIQQIRAFIEKDINSTCGVNNNISNASPKVDAGENHVIPANTPFELKGDATDAEDDDLIFAWQQLDAGELSPVNSDRGNNALFRVHPLSNNKIRSFPPIQNLLSHSSKRGENLPVQQRLMKFRLVVQDSHNTTQSDAMSILVRRTGSRFALNLPRSQYSLGGTHKILWNVANTDVAPVNCSSVELSLSVDGGYHFNQILGENLPNTGEAWVTIPTTLPITSRGRFKIRCSNNIFFAVSYRNFSINNQDDLERVILNDEDQPELNLKDVDLSKIDDVKYAEPSSSEAGGSIEWLFTLFLLIGVGVMRGIRFKKYI